MNYSEAHEPGMTPAIAALVKLIRTYLDAMLDVEITLLELNKLLYFTQEAGEDLRFRFRKGIYGPYAENLRHLLNRVEGHFVKGFEDGGESPDKPVELIADAVRKAEEFLSQKKSTDEHISRVIELVEGFESPFGLELLATVHWVANEQGTVSTDDIVHGTYAWNEQKKKFSHRQIALAAKTLSEHGFLKPQAA